MKSIFSFIVIFIATFSFFAFNFCTAQSLGSTSYETVQAAKSKTLIVPVFDSACNYNTIITNAVNQYWTFSKFELVTFQEINKYINKENNIFLLLTNHFVRNEGQSGQFKDYQTPNLTIAKKIEKKKKITNRDAFLLIGIDEYLVAGDDMICKLSVGVANFMVPRIELEEENTRLSETEYKLPLLVKCLNSYMNIVAGSKKKFDIAEWKKNNYNNAKQKKLLILKDDLSKELLMNKKYKEHSIYNIEVADKDYIENAIKSNDKTYLFFHLALGDISDVEYFVIDLETGNIVNDGFKGLVLNPSSSYYHIEEHELKVISEPPSKPKGCCFGIF